MNPTRALRRRKVRSKMSEGVRTDSSHVVLGKKYRDTVHGIEGIAASKHSYLSGCDRVTIEWVKDGEIKSDTFDVTQLLELPEEKPVETSRKAGGPGFTPPGKTTGR